MGQWGNGAMGHGHRDQEKLPSTNYGNLLG